MTGHNLGEMTVNSFANSVVLIDFASQTIFLRKVQNCLRIPESTESTFLDVCILDIFGLPLLRSQDVS